MIKFIKKTLGILVILSFFGFSNTYAYIIQTSTVNTNDILTKNLWNLMKTDLDNLANEFKFVDGDTDTDAIFTGGNVGIGTTNPGAKLEVAGDIKVGIDGTTPGKITFFNNTAETMDPHIAASSKSGGAGNDLEIKTNSTNGSIYIDATAHINFQTNSVDKMVILENGNVGIGTTSPTYRLSILGEGNSSQNLISAYNLDGSGGIEMGTDAGGHGFLRLSATGSATRFNLVTNGDNYFDPVSGDFGFGDTSPDAMVEVSVSGGASDLLMLSSDDANDGDLFIVKNSGNVGIGTTTPSYKLDVNGDITANAFLYSSDKKLKENIKNLDNFENILNIEPKRFDWKENKKRNTKNDIGVIAQDVELYFPEFVNTDDNGIKSVDYPKLVVPLIGVVKSQQKTMESLEKRIKQLENK